MARGRHLRTYAIRFVGSALVVSGVVWAILAYAPGLMSGAIGRGAVTGGAIGALLWPAAAFAKDHFAGEGGALPSAQRWGYAWRFALIALCVAMLFAVVAFAFGFPKSLGLSTLSPNEQGQIIGSSLALPVLLMVPINWLMITSGFKGAARGAARRRVR
ncbi:hypothetical protein GTA62_04175 [Roseobacter sp. HKCCD9010]|uniref:ABZJ_00895 family protein n=1 Tax=unclassified Roseobacter TaxID=196798 RepID=UPI001490B5E0|nr:MULTISPECIES: ABZJ_00895 family protein [unclassified Roseobacter]MBF9048934.1 hypothetical protein [Rhodobacterales bacterium HKCCD4356]NNV10933.1 hypothetical protein [Roseobacter sp. HKCCD7357]NNV15118.1 hypothetical protein [Roseobacter sp. HKCCD8768]NNV24577.1 hypothetical protein [Roseobacter sp. HKCCD8192]NNV28834.1 hypothetical protein [Roseobacter sp. HKCCD9061]